MTIVITLSVFFVFLLIDVPLTNVKATEFVVMPRTLVKFVVPKLPEIEYYARQEAKIEDITDEANLYYIPESERADVIEELLENPEVRKIVEECKKFHMPIVCSDSPYRSVDGSCNNLKHPKWGKAVTEQGRLLQANYEGTYGLRKSIYGGDLPPARSISLSMTNFSRPSSSASALFTFFGQFLAHDLSLTPSMTENGAVIRCCDPSKRSDPFCAAADISPDDRFYSQFNVTCVGLPRATPYPQCNFAEKRRVINKKSAFIDASQVYDDNEEHSRQLRTNEGGKLRSQDTKYGELLPENHNPKALSCPAAAFEQCFEAGDTRVNQHTMLAMLQTVFMRLHNNIADSLHKQNPKWGDEKVYQESRRIVIAMMECVVYEEYLLVLIGHEKMEEYDLYLNFRRGSQYDDEVDPSIFVEFAGAGFRPHSMVPTVVSKSKPILEFRNTYSELHPIHNGRLDCLLAGASEVPSEGYDEYQTDDISKYLYKPPGETFGGDMTLIDIQRGRDLGQPTYTEMVYFCTGLEIRSFSDLHFKGLMRKKNVRVLMYLYEDVNDIDLLIGLLREEPRNGVFGPTAACISSIQFYQLKFGDSFFLTHTNGRNPFNRGQLQFLRNYSLARIICETTRVRRVRKYPFMNPSDENPLIWCRAFPPMNLTAWKEESP